jgi:hypothetical protein
MQALHSARRRLATVASALLLTVVLTTAVSESPASADVVGGRLECSLNGRVAVHGVDSIGSTAHWRANGDYAIVEWWWWDFDARVWRTFYSQWVYWPYMDSPRASFHASGYTYWGARVWSWHPLKGYGTPYFLQGNADAVFGPGSRMCRTY